ncbi:MAG: hypothetical protein AB1540_11265 [Bdellovibrionota bacterium]
MEPSFEPAPTPGENREEKSLWLSVSFCLILLCVEIYALVYDLNSTSERESKGPVIATLKGASNEVRNKPAGTIAWRVPAAGDVLRRKESILTMPAATAVVAFNDGSEILIEPESLVTLEKTPSEDTPEYKKIIVKLLEGAIEKNSAGTLPLAVDVDGKSTLNIEDETGQAAFKIKRSPAGVEVQVTKGNLHLVSDGSTKHTVRADETALVAQGKVEISPTRSRPEEPVAQDEAKPSLKPAPVEITKPKPLPNPPRMRKPKIRLRDSRRSDDSPDEIRLSAAAKARKISIDLEWEPVVDAVQYRLQIARDKNFKDSLVDQTVNQSHFSYKTVQTAKSRRLYFRVASKDASGRQGNFSAAEEIEIDAIPVPSPPPVVATPSAPIPPPAPAKAREVAKPRAPVVASEIIEPHKFKLDLALGAAFHSRQFKNKSSNPLSAEGSGFVPAFGSLEGHITTTKTATLNAGAWFVAEQIEPTTENVIEEKLAIPLVRGWIAWEEQLWQKTAALGLYGSTSQEFSWNGRHAVAKRKMLIGLTAIFMGSRTIAHRWNWRTQLGLLGLGALGADVNLSIRYFLLPSKPVREVSYRGFFTELEGMGRIANIEISYGGLGKIGYAF